MKARMRERILARRTARELRAEEIEKISGGCNATRGICKTNYDTMSDGRADMCDCD